MRFGPTFRSVRMRPADGPSNGSVTLSRIRSLAGYTTAMPESKFSEATGRELRQAAYRRRACAVGALGQADAD